MIAPGVAGRVPMETLKMQMYRIKFARKINDATLDVGDVVLCATSQETALVMVAEILGLPVSDTSFDVSRVKPSFYQISRKIVDNSLSTYEADRVDARFGCRATFPGVTERRVERSWFSVSASADLHAESENDAIAMLSRAVAREMNGEKQKRSLRNLDIVSERAAERPRTAAVEQNALYEVRRIFRGGDARGG